ncbi:hypothetical protein Tco_0391064 [Tanacetum coccineum]
MEHTFELMDTVPPTPYDSPLLGGYTPGSDEGRLKLKELMAICTKLLKQVLDLEKEKNAQAVEILKLKQRVKKLERKRKSSISHPRRRIYMQVESSDADLDEEDASKQGRESDRTKSMFQDSNFDVLDDDIEDVEGETIHTTTTGVSAVSAPVTTASVAISTAKPRTSPTTVATAFIDKDLTIAQTLTKMKVEKAKEKGVAIKDVEDSPRPIRLITTLQPLPTIDPKDKELAQRLHEEELAELDRAQKERQNQEEATSAALAEEFDEIQARIDTDHELAKKEQLAAKKAEAIRNKPPTRTQVKNMMITYLNHIGKYTHQQLKHKNFKEVQKLYEKEKKWIDDFKPIDDERQHQAESTKRRPTADSEEESSKKQKLEEDNDAEKEELRDKIDVVPRDDVAIDVESLATKYPIVDWKTHILNENMMYYQIIKADGNSEEESSKKQKLEDDNDAEKEELRECMDVVPRDDVAIDVESLATKYPIVDWKTHILNENMMYYQIIRADRSSKNYKIFSEMLDDFDRQDVMDLRRLRLFDSCGVYVLLMNTAVAIHMMIEKKYPLTQEMLSRMLNRRLKVDYESEIEFELLRFTRSQLQK